MTVSVTLRSTKGAALTHAELDANFTNLKNVVDTLAPSGSVVPIAAGGTGLSVCVGAFAAIRGNSSGTAYEGATIEGTANQVSVSTGTANKWVLSTPQNIHTGASPTFAGLTLGSGTGLAKLTSGVVGSITDGTANQVLGMNNAANGYEYKTITGTSNRVTVTHAANSVTLTAPQDIHTGASPTFAGATIGSLSGLIKGTTGVLSAATAGTDYVAGGTGINGYVTVFTGSGAIGPLTGFWVSGGSFNFGTGSASSAVFALDAGIGNYDNGVYYKRNSVLRWYEGLTRNDEAGSDAGSNFQFLARKDDGTAIDTPVSIVRAAGGAITLARPTSVTNTTEATTHTAASLKVAGGLAVAKRIVSPKMFITEEGGFAVRLTAGENLTRGEIVYIPQSGTGNDGEVRKAPTSSDMPVGVVFQNASAAAEVVVITSGIAYVLPESGKTAARGNVLFASASEAGRADFSSTTPVSEHWRECGHFLDTGSGNGALCRALVHFN